MCGNSKAELPPLNTHKVPEQREHAVEQEADGREHLEERICVEGIRHDESKHAKKKMARKPQKTHRPSDQEGAQAPVPP